MAEIRRAHIHHKDGNPLNNDPSNRELLCEECHQKNRRRKGKNHTGIYIHVTFSPWLREEILKASGYRCQRCFALVGDRKYRRCSWCGGVATKANRVEWNDGRAMCRECLDDWTAQGRPTEYSPFYGRKL